ncbi:MAG TPA: hypothetical protein VMU43_08140 [Candidatus Acidoferrum sp.]|nr:hypothetical protein [Candidatus Acidoferrum sp.]
MWNKQGGAQKNSGRTNERSKPVRGQYVDESLSAGVVKTRRQRTGECSDKQSKDRIFDKKARVAIIGRPGNNAASTHFAKRKNALVEGSRRSAIPDEKHFM